MSEHTRNITPLFTVANQILTKFFRQEGADNYVSHVIEDLDHGQHYLITMQRVDGDTPLHQLMAAQERIATLETAIRQVQAIAKGGVEQFVSKQKHVAKLAAQALSEKT